jgi:hypothetical protein
MFSFSSIELWLANRHPAVVTGFQRIVGLWITRCQGIVADVACGLRGLSNIECTYENDLSHRYTSQRPGLPDTQATCQEKHSEFQVPAFWRILCFLPSDKTMQDDSKYKYSLIYGSPTSLALVLIKADRSTGAVHQALAFH